MLRYADQVGWRRVSRRQALQWRGGESGLFFSDILCQQLNALNPGVVDDTAANEILRQLNLLSATIEGNQAALAWPKGPARYGATTARRRSYSLLPSSLKLPSYSVSSTRRPGTPTAKRWRTGKGIGGRRRLSDRNQL
jgi:hypothetical protein